MKPIWFICGLLALLIGACVIGYNDPRALNKEAILLAPSSEHWFGTDRLGRDLFSRVIEGGKSSLLIGVLSAAFSSLIGLIIGVLAGYFKGVVDKAVVIVIDLFLTFPAFFLLLTLVSYVDASVIMLIVVISITGWMSVARMIRSEAFAIGSKPFIKILQIAKTPLVKIVFKYYAPILAPIFLIGFTFGVSGAILAESALSFLGLGITPPNMSWGSLLAEGKALIDVAWWVSFFPGLFIFFVTFTLVLLSDYLQKKFNNRETVS
ncbi:MAG: ABC transporter permease [Helicobacteraceae bacterium]|jgi:peptide/nickel transport system permease protein|nr:ABC transporter permease [Helicobacteraceae bacterium]